MRIVLVAKAVHEGCTFAAYAREVELPFVPTVGMKFKQGISTWLWETDGNVEFPPVKEVVYNFNEEAVYCLFEVKEKLRSSFWTEIKGLNNSFELLQFDVNS